jgi:hypothetical protein
VWRDPHLNPLPGQGEAGAIAPVRVEFGIHAIIDAHRDGKCCLVHADEKLTAFVERQVFTVTFYFESIRGDSCR